jgi:hypothetical protein
VLDVKHLAALEIRVVASNVNSNPVPNDFELWIDDVRFLR